jgi:hypothetical protein
VALLFQVIKTFIHCIITTGLLNKGKPLIASDGNEIKAIAIGNVLLYRHSVKIVIIVLYCNSLSDDAESTLSTEQRGETQRGRGKYYQNNLVSMTVPCARCGGPTTTNIVFSGGVQLYTYISD